jgi:hypothetical protein
MKSATRLLAHPVVNKLASKYSKKQSMLNAYVWYNIRERLGSKKQTQARGWSKECEKIIY